MNRIGLKTEDAQELSKELNTLLANYQLFYQNLRGFHWNIKGPDFFELHLKFEELYNDAQIKIDEIAERILTLGESPLHSFQEYLNYSEIKAVVGVSDGSKGLDVTLQGFQMLILQERKILKSAADFEDEGTVSLMSDYITETEKTVWMLASYLNR
jgi:starvation-inducible DNA-binding protein